MVFPPAHLCVCKLWVLSRALSALAVWALLCRQVVAPEPLLNDMPCSTLACPDGYQHRWNAAVVLCAKGACNLNDTDTCCVQGRFSSFSWRLLAASSVSEAWEVRKVQFLLADSCDAESEATTIPGIHWGYLDWPNGAAFSHQSGNGNTAAHAFVRDPAPTPRNPLPARLGWTSGGPCAESVCFLGFRWEADTNRYPAGPCRESQGICASTGLVRKVPALRIGCAAVDQSKLPGRFASELRLQFLETGVLGDANDTGGPEIWRTAAILRNISGGLARVQIEAVNITDTGLP